MTNVEKQLLRRVVADLICSAGCNCCRDETAWAKAQADLAKMLRVPKYDDGSGYNFHKFMTPK